MNVRLSCVCVFFHQSPQPLKITCMYVCDRLYVKILFISKLILIELEMNFVHQKYQPTRRKIAIIPIRSKIFAASKYALVVVVYCCEKRGKLMLVRGYVYELSHTPFYSTITELNMKSQVTSTNTLATNIKPITAELFMRC